MVKTVTELGGSYFFGVQAITKKEREVLGCYLLNVVICLGCWHYGLKFGTFVRALSQISQHIIYCVSADGGQ